MAPAPGGEFLWHMGFQSVPDVAHDLIAGREDVYLGHIFERYAYDPHAVRPERMRHYVEAMRAVGALLEKLPKPLLSRDAVTFVTADNACDNRLLLKEFGIKLPPAQIGMAYLSKK